MERRSTQRGLARQGLRPVVARRRVAEDQLDHAVALFDEDRRWCPHCEFPVGRRRDGRPGRLRGTCPHCRRDFDLTPELSPGDVLGGRWTIGGLLARGSDWLYTARDRQGRDVVVGRHHHDDAATPTLLLGRGHPALVGLRDVVSGPDAVHLVLDPVDGSPARGPLDPVEAATVVLGVLPAVEHLHRLGVLHADLSPGNVLRTPAGPVLVDLGSVRRADDRRRAVLGTDGFLAPEIAPGAAGPSIASEIYGLGRTLAVLLGRPVHPHRAPRRPPDEPTQLDPVIARATATDPALRHPDVTALAEDLVDALAAGGTDNGETVHQDDPCRPAAPARTYAPRGAFPP